MRCQDLRSTSHSTTPPEPREPYPAAAGVPPGLKATLDTEPPCTVGGPSTPPIRPAASPTTTAPPPTPTPTPLYPAATVLPSGLKATLETSPSFTGRTSASRFRRAASHSTTPP